ncbi:hypothetical protein SAMN02745702_02545 [Desulfobaculum bizertense DSM 18034]|uniref:Uncharacterized protein n=1 Tax=Desulfobaculum bizertense DSM 18034 TaxID=1121442 RepID=A0A1T4WQF2_9BACT|nr:hypothetical protein SAMN02745702_02545 [Desulfobaculum bizertense DSM 18034]
MNKGDRSSNRAALARYSCSQRVLQGSGWDELGAGRAGKEREVENMEICGKQIIEKRPVFHGALESRDEQETFI